MVSTFSMGVVFDLAFGMVTKGAKGQEGRVTRRMAKKL